MAAPFLVASLARLRDEFNALNPARDKGADGWIGDAAHQGTVSDHNPDDTPGVRTPYTDADTTPEVHALDIDSTGPWPKPFGGYVQTVVDRHRIGADDRLQNVIWDRQIASRSWDWVWHPYTGADPHTGHAHFSCRYTTEQERDVSPWGILETDMATLDPADIAQITAAVNSKVWGYPYGPGQSMLAKITELFGRVEAIATGLQTLAGRDFTDEADIAAQVLAGLTRPDKTTQEIADALRPALGDRAAEVGRLLAN